MICTGASIFAPRARYHEELDMKKLISIVTPAYNEETNIGELVRRLAAVFDGAPEYDFEAIVVDNGSTDGTWSRLQEVCGRDPRFKSLQLSRNFTAPGGITAGLRYARGEAAIVMCADLQDPPEKIPDLIRKWGEGYDIVYQIVTERKGASFSHRVFSVVYHSLMAWLTNDAFPKNGTVFRLMSRPAYEAFNSLNETNRYFTGLCSWIGFKSTGVKFVREDRFSGEAKSQFLPMVQLALNGIFAFSYVPLKLMSMMGVTIAFGSFGYLTYIVVLVLKNGSRVPGLPTVIAVNLLLFGMLFLFLGIIGEYLARIYDEVKDRPNFIVRESIGLKPK
jgi:glycosyltransferase involved in cell wall biosynthesis